MLSYRDFIARPGRPCAVIAHRGAWRAGAPENSVAAIGLAQKHGYEIVEIDIRKSSDGVLFVFHDKTLERMTSRSDAPEDLKIAELTALRLREGDGGIDAPESNETIPTLEEALAAAKAAGRYLDLDVKTDALMEETALAAAAAGGADIVNIKFPINSDATLERALKIERESGVAVVAAVHLTSTRDETLMRNLAALRPMMIQATADSFDNIARVASEVARHGSAIWNYILDVAPWPNGLDESAALADPSGVWGAAIDAGVSAIMTDHPAELAHYIQTRG